MTNRKCQLYNLVSIGEPLDTGERIFQLRNRVKRIFKRRLRYLQNTISEIVGKRNEELQTSVANSNVSLKLKPGDIVCVKSREEIQNTLNRWNSLKGCAFMEEMWPYCGTVHRVFKCVNQFLDERSYLIRKCKGIVLLEGVVCNGTKDYGPCDRSCFLFWREEWLKKTGD